MAGFRRILIATDFSSASRKAFTTAVDIAKANRSTLMILHVLAPFAPIVPEQYVDTRTWDRIDKEARRWGTLQLRRLADRARKAGVRVTGLLVDGDPAQAIVRVARMRRADLLVVGTHGRTGLSKFVTGSIAARIVATATCPVVTVRGA
jgi:nucleotide-binding universal stress UspA family protein